MMKKHIASAAALAAVFASSALSFTGCYIEVSDTYYATGSAEYWVEVEETIYDEYGYSTTAFCADYVTFTGYIDDRCARLPMVHSFARNAWLTCSYVDYWGDTYYYDEQFYFGAGFIAEYDCYNDPYYYGSQASSDDLEQELEVVQAKAAAESTLSRDAEGRLVIDKSLGADVQASRVELRAKVIEKLQASQEISMDETLRRLRRGEAVITKPSEHQTAPSAE